MKHIFRFSAFTVLMGVTLLLGSQSAFAQLTANLSQTLNFPNVNITVSLTNTTNTPQFVGESDFSFVTNSLGLNNAAVALVTPGIWHNNAEYDALEVTNVTTGGNYIRVAIRPRPTITTGIAIGPNATETVAVIRIPVAQCTLTNTLAWEAGNTIISDVRFNPLYSGSTDLRVTGGPLALAPAFTAPAMAATVGTPGRPVGSNIINMCKSERFSLTIPTTTGAVNYQFIRNGQPLGPPSTTNTYTSPANITPPLQSGDQVWGLVYTNQCSYRTTNTFTLAVQDTLPAPTFVGIDVLDTGLCATSLAGSNTPIRVLSIPTATSYTYTLTPAGIGTITGTSNNVTLTWTGAAGLCTLSVNAVNLCGNGLVARKVFRIYPGAPTIQAGSLRRARRADTTDRATSYKINDPENRYFEFLTGNVNNRSYEFQVRPRFALADTSEPSSSIVTTLGINDYPFLEDNSRTRDSLRLRVDWNRFYQDTVAFIRYRSVNACGKSRWDSLKVNFTTLVPRPDSVRVVRSSDGSVLDSICQGSADSTFFRAFFANALAGSEYSTKRRPFRYFITRDNATSIARGLQPGPGLPPAAIGPLANYQTNFRKYFVSDSTGFWANWNPLYFGAVRVVAAGYTDTANYGGLPISRFAGIPGLFAPGADTSGMGDTVSFSFFIKPKPLRPTAAPVTYFNNVRAPEYRAIHRGVDTAVTICLDGKVKPLYATRGQWYIKPAVADTNFRSDTVGQFVVIPGVDSSAYCIRLRLRPDAKPGRYDIYMRGINDCGLALQLDSSSLLRIHITDTAVRRPQPIQLVQGGTLAGFNFCQGATTSTRYRVKGADSLDYTYYEWRLEPATAGTITVDNARALDQGAVTVNWGAFSGNVKLFVYAIAGPNRANPYQSQFADSVSIRVFPQPTAYAGNGHNMPAFSSAYIGGTGMTQRYNRTGVTEPVTVANTFARVQDSVRVVWSSTPPNGVSMLNGRPATATGDDIGRATNPSYTNPLFTPTAPGSYSFSVKVVDSTGCESNPSTINFNVAENWNLGVRALLSGALQQPVTAGSPRMRNDLFRQGTGQSPVGFFDRYEGYNSSGMNRGFTVRRIVNPFAGGPDSLGPVDVVNVGVISDYDCGPGNTLPAFNVVAEGRAWLYPDGTIRDFETGTAPYARIIGGSGTPPTGLIAFVAHRNHMTLFSTTVAGQNVVPATGANAPGATLPTGTADLSREANVIRSGTYQSGVGSEWLVPGGGGPTPQTRRVAAVAGDIVKEAGYAINNFDLLRAKASTPQTDVYDDLDVNLDRNVDAADLAVVEQNVRQFKYSVILK